MAGRIFGDVPAALGAEMHGWIEELLPMRRSITGEGLRATLRWIQGRIPLTIEEVPTGAEVFDWRIPAEWRVESARIEGPDGEPILDLDWHPLHLVGYSVPFSGSLSREELDEHLHSLPEHPDWIPYRTSYYTERWGFCLPHRQRATLREGVYEVRIDASLEEGSLSYGELLLPGEREEEMLFSCHVCHPGMANDNLSGLAVAVAVARILAELPDRRWSYRFLFVPGTIGSIAWLARNRERASRIGAGLVLTCLGDRGGFHYKRSRRGDSLLDRAAEHVLATAGEEHEVEGFSPFGYDERQYCSPGFDLPVGRLSRTPNGRYPEYHTSADDASFVTSGALGGSVGRVLEIVEVLEHDRVMKSTNPHCEPQLGRRGLYRSVGGTDVEGRELALLWVLNLADGEHGLLDTARRAGLPFTTIAVAARDLEEAGLLEEVGR